MKEVERGELGGKLSECSCQGDARVTWCEAFGTSLVWSYPDLAVVSPQTFSFFFIIVIYSTVLTR
jgi:hypothetical protein